MREVLSFFFSLIFILYWDIIFDLQCVTFSVQQSGSVYITFFYSFPYSFPKWEFLDTCKPVMQMNNASTLYKMETREI